MVTFDAQKSLCKLRPFLVFGSSMISAISYTAAAVNWARSTRLLKANRIVATGQILFKTVVSTHLPLS